MRYNEEAQRIEMHLRSLHYQIVSIPSADLIVDFVPNETICTEACHKFLPKQIFDMARTDRLSRGCRLDGRGVAVRGEFTGSGLAGSR